MSDGTLRIAIVGAESTGKTTLARELGAALAAFGVGRVAVVAEWLREWCDLAGRTPRADEQAAILREQHERIEAAATRHEIVVADTTGLMTATYSRLLFDDASLEADAVARHRQVAVTLLTAIDLPWVADGHQRDGAHVREPVDAALRELLARHALPFHVIGGRGQARLAQALAALQPALRGLATSAVTVRVDDGDDMARASAPGARRRGGLTALEADAVPAPDADATDAVLVRRWRCECCWPEGERASLARRR
jgi:nicotinamide riboside kinase